eukprot:Selendium_serpulae@DN6958_c0_g1_i2.p1
MVITTMRISLSSVWPFVVTFVIFCYPKNTTHAQLWSARRPQRYGHIGLNLMQPTHEPVQVNNLFTLGTPATSPQALPFQFQDGNSHPAATSPQALPFQFQDKKKKKKKKKSTLR